jgi:uncharacterized protein
MSSSTQEHKPNRLINEKSPYLLQHAYNPVDWYAWGDEAFAKAKNEDKPIFLSIGYSTCHWCHVMEHESFEDPEVAALMNDVFVSIKVDREERPDIDNIYMTLCQMMTGSGGWPLNMIITPDKKPFFAGTYLPRDSRGGRIGMTDLAPRIKEVWQTRRNEVYQSAEQIFTALKQMPEDTSGEAPGSETLQRAFNNLLKRYDPVWGGFKPAPKFPTAHNLYFLLRYAKRVNEPRAVEMVSETLDAVRKGGIYDQIGYGIHRYSTDEEWLVPHFEKMLYDQALMAIAFIEAYQVTGNENYADTAKEIFTYVLRDMTAPEGAFYSAEDADSEGVEGKFYVWSVEELVSLLGVKDTQFISYIYNMEPGGNFAEESTGHKTGLNIPHRKKSMEQIAADMELPLDEFKARFESIRLKLLDARSKRVRPHKDDKILTDWNGLMIAALAKGAQVFGNEEYARAAVRAADFILSVMRDGEGLLHRFRDGEAVLPGNADDYAFLISGLLEIYEANFDPTYLRAALDLNKCFIDRFWDGNVGGFYFSPESASDLLVRKKEVYDGAIPSANSVGALNLLRLSHITGDPDLENKAEMLTRAFSETVKQYPSGYTNMLCALEFALGPSQKNSCYGQIRGR